jgi:hypothetical protein
MFILLKDRSENSDEEWQTASKAYRNYLESIKDRLPLAAYEFAAAPWHFNADSHRDLHDSWLEAVTIAEPSSGERSQHRSIDINIRLLGPYHDGHIEIAYTKVRSYSMVAALNGSEAGEGHGDWLYDEIRLSARGYLLHEIEWSRGGDWLIEFKDFEYRWIPLY